MNDGDYNYAEAFRKMMFYKEHHRPIEDIVAELQHELSPVTEESLLIHAMRMILELEYRTVSPLYQHLQSPMRQTLYLMDVYYSISDREELVEMDKERWEVSITATACRSNSLYSSSLNGLETVKSFIVLSLYCLNLRQ